MGNLAATSAVSHVLIAGAGLAGAAAAIRLAAGGVLTELLLSSAELDDALWAAFTTRRFGRAKAVVEASCRLTQWQLDHEQGDVMGLIAAINALITQPA